jgi:hypothetical protein
MPRDWFDTPLPKPRRFKPGLAGTWDGVLRALADYEFHAESTGFMMFDLYVEPAGYHEARRAIYWTVPAGIYINLMMLEL